MAATPHLAAQDPLVMRIAPVAPQVFVISGFTNGNIVAVVGKSGVLLVDGQSGKRVALADSALRNGDRPAGQNPDQHPLSRRSY